jgi:2-polyprenyl-6-methoxyphenol hydroxylase-like FAD-dependent oxidoreductase
VSRSRHAIVVGGSLAGLFAANVLVRDGWAVTVYERVDSGLDGRGAGIATHAELFIAMRQAGALVDERIGLPIRGRTAFDRAGNELCHFAYPQYLTSWTLLYRRLHAALPAGVYHLGRDVVDVVDGEARATVVLLDGSQHHADLVVGADGVWSTVRARMNPRDVPQYAGYVAWRGLIHESAVTPQFAERYAPIHGFYLEDDHQLVHFAVTGVDDGTAPGERRFSFLWYLPYDETSELPDLLTGVDGVRNSHSISPLRIHPKHVEKLRRDARDRLPPDFAATVGKTERPFVQPIYDLLSTRIGFRRVALVGDAAFVARPHVGAGVTKAGSDVVALAAALRHAPDVASALAEFDRGRTAFGRAIVELSRTLGDYLAGPRPGRARRAPPPPERLIREVAMPLKQVALEETP